MLTHLLKTIWRSMGCSGSAVTPARAPARPPLGCYRACQSLFDGKVGLEIGGPSTIFSRSDGIFPVYPAAERIDNANFSRQTIWGEHGADGTEYLVDEDGAAGKQYIAEATELRAIASESYDFVLSSHTLEHVANPIRALTEWMRVLREDGALILVLPHKEGTFDHRRPVTTLGHLLQDFEHQTTEADLTHLDEILGLHDLALDPGAGAADAFRQRSLRNPENRCLHHHVFDMRLVVEVVVHMGLQIHALEAVLPYHILVVAQKVKPGEQPRNERFTRADPRYLHDSPFSS